MLNTLDAYRNAGEQAGRASKQHDQGRVSHWKDWAARAWNMETPEYRALAQAEYEAGYRDGSGYNCRKPEYFR